MTPRRLTVIATGPSGSPDELDPLRAAGHEVIIGRPLDMPGRRAYAESELIEQVRAADVVLASHLERITPSVMEHAEHLGLVIVPFIGVDKIDVPAATRLGVLVANSPTKENFIAVAEATIGLLLMLLKRVKRGESRLRSGEWARREDRGDFLFGKTVGIVGLGRIGLTWPAAAGWDVRLLAADPYVPIERAAAVGDAGRSADAAGRVRIVTVHAVLTGRRAIIGERAADDEAERDPHNTARGEWSTGRGGARRERALDRQRRSTRTQEPLPNPHPYRASTRAADPHPAQHRPQRGRRANLALALSNPGGGRGDARPRDQSKRSRSAGMG